MTPPPGPSRLGCRPQGLGPRSRPTCWENRWARSTEGVCAPHLPGGLSGAGTSSPLCLPCPAGDGHTRGARCTDLVSERVDGGGKAREGWGVEGVPGLGSSPPSALLTAQLGTRAEVAGPSTDPWALSMQVWTTPPSPTPASRGRRTRHKQVRATALPVFHEGHQSQESPGQLSPGRMGLCGRAGGGGLTPTWEGPRGTDPALGGPEVGGTCA